VNDDVRVHPSASVEEGAQVGRGTRIWHQAQVRAGAVVGQRCVVGKGAFIDTGVTLGDACKIQNYACLYRGATIGRGVFIGPHAVLTNDRYPRAVTVQFEPLGVDAWTVGQTIVEDGASIGARATILPGVRIGRWSLVAAGATVTRDVPAFALVAGTPARNVAWVCPCGLRVTSYRCQRCGPLPNDHPLL
jgi:UDP-2-acetamido-3-amino-2,3-dideoxy-glucuronate N-acetyltransferase